MDREFEVDIRPDAAALRMFRSLSFTAWYALGEFVDNSISSYFLERERLEDLYGSDYTCNVRINFDESEARLTVEDDAAGIALKDMERALRTGEPPPDTAVGLNLHGVGMKAAAFWWGRHLKIETWPIDDASGWTVEIDLGEAGTVPDGIVTIRPLPGCDHSGTKITVSGLWQMTPVASRTRGKVAAFLPSIYRKFIAVEQSDTPYHPVRLFLDDKELSFEPPRLLRAAFWPSAEGPDRGSAEILWRKEISFTLASRHVIKGWVGILETMSRELSGFVLHYRGKGIGGVTPVGSGSRDSNSGFRPREIFGQVGSYRSQSFIGEFDVSDFGKSITTDSTLWNPDEEEEFVDKVLAALKDPEMDMWSMAVNFKRRRRAQIEESGLRKASTNAALQMRDATSGQISHGLAVVAADHDLPDPTDLRFVIQDREIHQHHFGLRFSMDRNRQFVALSENMASRDHLVVVNENHPMLDDLPPVDVNTRTLITRIALALCAAEVFVDSPDRHEVRKKMNAILEMVHPVPDDLPEDD